MNKEDAKKGPEPAAKEAPNVKKKPQKSQPGGDTKWIEFPVLRDDPYDAFKPNSEEATHHLAQTPKKQKLTPDEETLLQGVAANLDRTLSVEEIIKSPYPKPNVSHDIYTQLNRLPIWLRAMIETRFADVQKIYGEDTLNFLRSVANRIDKIYLPEVGNYNGPAPEDKEIDKLENREILDLAFDLRLDETEIEKNFRTKGTRAAAFRVAHILAKWEKKKKKKGKKPNSWSTDKVERASTKLRGALSIRPPQEAVAFAKEDDAVRDEESESEVDESDNWRALVQQDAERREVEAEIAREVKLEKKGVKRLKEFEKHLQKKTKDKKKTAKDKEKKATKNKEKKTEIKEKTVKGKEKEKDAAGAGETTNEDTKEETEDEQTEKMKHWKSVREKLEKKKMDRSVKAKEAAAIRKRKENSRKDIHKQKLARGQFRRYSKLLKSGCGDPIDPPQRLEHQYRSDESFHAYIVAIVTSIYFKAFVMFVILLNALVLAIETFDVFEKHVIISEIIDEMFLAFYLTEAIMKIYAHPYRYWQSGFNVFDFIILVISIIKMLVDWMDLADVSVLGVLLIIRALRVLRGVSLSVQLQVLVTALVETIKTNILSIVILLILLLYIAAIIAYYLFGDKEGLVHTWGTVEHGMLRMVSFVTLDGWFDLMEEFEEAGYQLGGRVFNLICIVLGNFMFSNIFIAIIIMNISEATDVFREKMRAEGEDIVRRKKELVFRRQKLDMRQLLARQKTTFSADFFYLAGKFQKLLRHDDLVAMTDICTSPLWIDSCYQTGLRSEYSANRLMNLHREMADNLLEQYRLHNESKMQIEVIRHNRFDRYIKLKAKLAMIKKELVRLRMPEPATNLRISFTEDGDKKSGAQQKATSEGKNFASNTV